MDKYDVYKVETIADSYMVVSGLPEPNGYTHIRDVSLLALELQSHIQSFDVPHDVTLKLQLRIGIHTGKLYCIIRTVRMLSIPTYPTTYPPTYPPTNLPTYPPTNLPTYPPTYLPTHLPTYPPTYIID